MGGVGPVSCDGFLVGGTCVCLCSGAWNLISFLWRALQCPAVSFGFSMGLIWLWGFNGFDMAFSYLLMFRAVFLFYWRISVEFCSLLGGFWPQWRYGEFGVGFHISMFPGVRSSMMVQSSGVELSACGFLS